MLLFITAWRNILQAVIAVLLFHLSISSLLIGIQCHLLIQRSLYNALIINYLTFSIYSIQRQENSNSLPMRR